MKALPVFVLAAACVAALAWLAARAPSPSLLVRSVPAVTVLTDRGTIAGFREQSTRSLVVFGYTRCRDACPLLLAESVRVTSAIPPARRPRIVFVTVDPGFDRPAVLARWLTSWDKSVHGITGSRAALEQIYAAFTGAGGLPAASDDHDVRIFAVDALGEIADAPDRGVALERIARTLADQR